MTFDFMGKAAAQAQAALEAAKKEREATAAAEAAEGFKQQEQVIEDAMEHAGISGVDVQIDDNGFAKLVGTVTSEVQQQTAVSIAEQFELSGMEVEIEVIEAEADEGSLMSMWEEAAAAQPVTYTTKKGDSWWGISKKFYDDGTKWKSLKRANGWPRMLHPNQELTIPPADQLSKWESEA